MKDDKLKESITVNCPNGHRLRGDKSFLGKTVRCPRCQCKFSISATSDDRKVTDTAVMRILGELPTNASPASIPARDSTRPCPRCGVATSEAKPVCEHCNTYLGAMPRFMKDIVDDRRLA